MLGHEIGHVLARHGAQHIAKAQLTQGLAGAAVVATQDPSNPNSQASAAVIQAIGQLVNMKYGRSDELQADKLGIKFMAMAGYDPIIPLDEVIETAKRVAKQMPRELRCTALGGLSITPTSLALEKKLAGKRAACGKASCGCK